MYIAVGITKEDIWVCLSIPCSYDKAMEFKGCQLANETFDVKTVEEVNNHKKVLR